MNCPEPKAQSPLQNYDYPVQNIEFFTVTRIPETNFSHKKISGLAKSGRTKIVLK